jgi:glycerol kinase
VILAIDQGTTGTTCLVVSAGLEVVGRGYAEVPQHFPQPGWVEHDPDEIWASVEEAAALALRSAGIPAAELEAIGIANQRETTLLWERRSGRPVQRAIVWQDRRTAERCRELPFELIRARTGLTPDPYFSATKLEWLLAHAGARPEELAFGTVDSWLAWRLTAGDAHVTDPSNASRTLLLGLASLDWDDELLELFGVPRGLLPQIRSSSEVVGEARLLGAKVPLAGIAGDQQAALFGHACFRPGEAKATYGTGNFVLVHSGSDCSLAPDGLLRTVVACRPGERAYALEGSVFVTGAAIQWLRDGLGLLADAAESEAFARSLEGNGGVYFVPALAGLGSPHWRPDVRGVLSGLTRGTGRAELARAALEAIAYQTRDVVEAMPVRPEVLRADGGATANAFLMQFQADVLRLPVEVSAESETTALGAAALAGLALGAWSEKDVAAARKVGARYEPERPAAEVDELLAGWHAALERAFT